MLTIGFGSVPIHVFTPTYLNQKFKNIQPMLLSIVYSIGILGPAVSVVVGGKMLDWDANFDYIPSSGPQAITASGEQIGAWWPGFITLGVILCFSSLFLFLLPGGCFECIQNDVDIEVSSTSKTETLTTEVSNSDKSARLEDETQEIQAIQKEIEEIPEMERHTFPASNCSKPKTHRRNLSLKSLPKNVSKMIPKNLDPAKIEISKSFIHQQTYSTLWNTITCLFTNKIWIFCCLYITCECYFAQIMIAFAAKYISLAFLIKQSESSILAGICSMFGALTGYILSGIYLKWRGEKEEKAEKLALNLDPTLTPKRENGEHGTSTKSGSRRQLKILVQSLRSYF